MRVISSLRVAPVAAASVFPVCRRSWMWICGSPDAASALAHTFEKLLRRRNEDQLMRNSPGQPGLGHLRNRGAALVVDIEGLRDRRQLQLQGGRNARILRQGRRT
jgi:hypothetical protein